MTTTICKFPANCDPKLNCPEQVVSTTAWAASFLMIVPIFLYAHTQQVNADWPPGGNSTGLPPTDTTPFNRTTTAAPFTQPIVSCNIYWPESEYMNGQAAFTLYTFTLAFAIPLVLILVFYILVIRKLQVSAISWLNFQKYQNLTTRSRKCI